MSEAFKFLGSVLEKGGVVAALFFLVIFAFGYAIRALWQKNQALHKQLQDQQDVLKRSIESHGRQVQKLQSDHVETLKALAQQHTADLKTLAEQHTKEKRAMGVRIDDLQETRVTETREVTEKVMAYIQHIDQFVAKLEVTIDVLMDAARRN